MKWLPLVALLYTIPSHAQLEYLGRSVASAERKVKKSGYKWDGAKWVLPGSRRHAVAFKTRSDGTIYKIIEWNGSRIDMIE